MFPITTEFMVGGLSVEQLPRRFALADIQSATNNFHEELIIGTGGFGKVYKGVLDDGATIVAVKRLNQESKQGLNEFYTEVNTLYSLRHNNLVRLIGHVKEDTELILIYEYMANGTLAENLYVSCKKRDISDFCPLTWEQRLCICVQVARGLDYLYKGCGQSYIHRDMKTSNILLDENRVAKISGFGLTKRKNNDLETHIITQVKGTYGYLDPEYYQTGRLTDKSDVYAFGVVLLEVLFGRPAVDTSLEEHEIALVRWFDHCVKEGKIEGVIDPTLDGQISTSCLKSIVQVAVDCLCSDPSCRPSMANVVRELEQAMMLHHEAIRRKDGGNKGVLNKVRRNDGENKRVLKNVRRKDEENKGILRRCFRGIIPMT